MVRLCNSNTMIVIFILGLCTSDAFFYSYGVFVHIRFNKCYFSSSRPFIVPSSSVSTLAQSARVAGVKCLRDLSESM